MNIASEIANKLLEIEAVKINFKNPFTWTSGLRSPIYCDNRKTLSYPEVRKIITKGYVEYIKGTYKRVNVIAGIATAGIAQGALIAEELNLSYCYVRPEPKKHGMKNQIEGHLIDHANMVLIEDLISTGMSSLKAVEACRAEGANVLSVISIFNYGFDDAKNAFQEADCEFFSLCTLNDLMEQAVLKNYVKASDFESLNLWRSNPKAWSAAQSV